MILREAGNRVNATLVRIAALVALALLVGCGALSGCSDEADVRDLWQELPHPNAVGLNGSVQQIAAAMAESVELPGDYDWEWEHVEEDWDAAHPLIRLSHGLTLERHGVPGDGALPRELVALIEDSWHLSLEDFSRYAVQPNRVVLLYVGPDRRPEPVCVQLAFLVDVRRVTGGGRDDERWMVEAASSLVACPRG